MMSELFQEKKALSLNWRQIISFGTNNHPSIFYRFVPERGCGGGAAYPSCQQAEEAKNEKKSEYFSYSFKNNWI